MNLTKRLKVEPGSKVKLSRIDPDFQGTHKSEDEAKEAFVRYRPRLRNTGYLWMITRKRGHEKYLNQMALVPYAKRLGLIDNKTCSIDEERSGIRFVIPRSLRRDGSQSAA